MDSYFDDPIVSDDEIKKGGDSDDDDSSSSASEEIQENIDNDAVEEDEVEVEEPDEDEDEDEDNDDNLDTDTMKGGADGEDGMRSEEDEGESEEKAKKIKKIPAKTIYKKPEIDDDDDEDDDEDGEMYLQKFDRSVNNNYIVDFHPESVLQNYDEILSMTKVIRDKNDIIVDDLHRTIPYLTKYERARILGQRAKQINAGSPPFIKVPENVIDGYLIAEMELKEKRIPFIIRRPLPNGGSEYWSIKDLEDIMF